VIFPPPRVGVTAVEAASKKWIGGRWAVPDSFLKEN
jgi:hypothetical protein